MLTITCSAFVLWQFRHFGRSITSNVSQMMKNLSRLQRAIRQHSHTYYGDIFVRYVYISDKNMCMPTSKQWLLLQIKILKNAVRAGQMALWQYFKEMITGAVFVSPLSLLHFCRDVHISYKYETFKRTSNNVMFQWIWHSLLADISAQKAAVILRRSKHKRDIGACAHNFLILKILTINHCSM